MELDDVVQALRVGTVVSNSREQLLSFDTVASKAAERLGTIPRREGVGKETGVSS